MKYFVNLMIAATLICAACLTSCKDGEGEKDTTVQRVTITQSEVLIMKGASTTVAATVFPNAASQDIRWTVEDNNIATITDKGRIDGISAIAVTGASLGSTTVTATSADNPDIKASIEVTVTTFIDSVTVDIDTVAFVMGNTEIATIEAKIFPSEAIQTVTWTSSNPAAATVSNGVIKAVGAGTATITAVSIIDTTKKATVAVECVSLVNKVIHVASKFGNGLTVSWVNMGGDLVEFFYTNSSGQRVSSIYRVTTQSSYVPGFASGPLSFRTMYFSGGGKDTISAPIVDFTGSIYDLTHYINSYDDKNIIKENVIKAADFDLGGEGIGFHDSNSANTALNYRRDRGDSRSDAVFVERGTAIGNIAVDDWWQYTVDVVDAGTYKIDISISVNSTTAKCRVEVDGVKSEEYSLKNNESWEDWRYYFDFNRLDPPVYYLTKGKHVLRMHVVSTGFNFNGLRLVYQP
jgi:hypothetical protein